MNLDPKTVAVILNTRGSIEELRTKVDCQDLVLSRYKNEIESLKSEKRAMDTKMYQCHAREVQLTAENEGNKRELALIREMNKRLEADNARLLRGNDEEKAKRQKLRKSSRLLDELIWPMCNEATREALTELKDGLMG
jgi:chromosome segregation ATPase